MPLNPSIRKVMVIGSGPIVIGQAAEFDYAHIPAFSVQFHPEAAAGPRDTSYLFDRFMQLIDDNPVEV